jgi:hypothetical protein
MDAPCPSPVGRPRRRVAWLIVITLAAAAATTAVVVIRDRTQRPTQRPMVFAKLYIPKKPPGLLSASVDSHEPDFEVFRQTQAEAIRSRLVLSAALRPPEVANLSIVRRQADPLAWLARSLVVDFPSSPEVMRVGLQGDPAGDVVVLVNAVKDAYLSDFANRTYTSRNDQLRRLQDLAKVADDSARRTREVIWALRAEEGSATSRAAEQELVDCRRELRRVRLARVAADKGSGKGGESAAVLAEQEQVLRVEEEQLVAQLGRWEKGDTQTVGLRASLVRAEARANRLHEAADELMVELDAPLRVVPLENATVAVGD